MLSLYILRHVLAHMDSSVAFTGTHRDSPDINGSVSWLLSQMGYKSESGWAYCQRHKEVTEQELPKVLPSCYESTENDGKDADDDVQGILFPVTDK